MTPEQQRIILTLQKSLLPNNLSQLEEQIQELRKSPNYLGNIIDILSQPFRQSKIENQIKENSYQYSFSQQVLMCMLIEMQKNAYKSTNQLELCKVKQNMLGIILRLSNKKTYKQIKKIVKLLTYANLFGWFNVNECIDILESNSNRQFFIQSLIGIVDFNLLDEPKFVVMDIYEIFTYFIQKLTTFKPSEIPSVFEFIQKYINIFPKQQIQTFTSTILPFYISVSSTMYQHTKCIEEQIRASAYLSIKFIHKTFTVWIKKCIDNGLKQLTEIWKQKYVIDFFKNSINQIYHNPSTQISKEQNLQIAEQLTFFLPKFFRINSQIDWNVEIQMLLYHSIPKVLFQLTDIILFGNQSIGYDDFEENVSESNIKKNVLQFWISLSSTTQKDPQPQPISRPIFNNIPKSSNQKKIKVSKYRAQPPEPQPQKILTSLSGFPLHFKFIFQKLTSSPTIFSPYILDKSLKQKDPFPSSFSSPNVSAHNPKWTIVILNILQAMKPILQTIVDDNIIKCIPSILPVYILPLLKSQSWSIRANALSLIGTYSEQFQKLRVGSEILGIFDKMLNSENSELMSEKKGKVSQNENEQQEENCEKQVLLRVLPLLARNSYVSKFVQKNVDSIISSCLQYAKQSQLSSTCQILSSLNQVLTKYRHQLDKPQKYIQVLIAQLISHINTPYPNYPSPYPKTTEIVLCILSLIRTCAPSTKLHPFLISPIRKLVFLLPHHPILRTDIFRLLSQYVYYSCKTNTLMMTIYAAICCAVSFWDNQILGMLPQQVKSKVIGIKKGLEVEGQEEILVDKIWLMHMFSLKIKMLSQSMTLKIQPVSIYIQSLYKCISKLNKSNFKQVQSYSYFDIVNMILKSLICLLQALRQNETSEELEVKIIRIVWKLAVEQVWINNMKQFDHLIRQSQTPAKTNDKQSHYFDEEQNAGVLEEITKVKANFVRVFGLMLDFNSEVTFSHIHYEPQLLQHFLQILHSSSQKQLCTLPYFNCLTFTISSLICSEPIPDLAEEQIKVNQSIMLKVLKMIINAYINNNQRQFLGFQEVWLQQWEDQGFGYEQDEFDGVVDMPCYDYFKYKEVNCIDPEYQEIKNMMEYLRDNKQFQDRNQNQFQQVCQKWVLLQKQINSSFSLDNSDSLQEDEEDLVDHFGAFKFD